MFRLTQGFYYLFLGTWLGALVMLALAAAITFHTLRDLKATTAVEPYHSLSAAEQPSALAGAVVGNVLHGLAVVQVVCAVGAVGCILLQHTVWAGHLAGGRAAPANITRLILLALPVLILLLDVAVISPRIWQQRDLMYDPHRPAELRQAARQRFDRLHHLDERVVGGATVALAAGILVSGFAFRDPEQ